MLACGTAAMFLSNRRKQSSHVRIIATTKKQGLCQCAGARAVDTMQLKGYTTGSFERGAYVRGALHEEPHGAEGRNAGPLTDEQWRHLAEHSAAPAGDAPPQGRRGLLLEASEKAFQKAGPAG